MALFGACSADVEVVFSLFFLVQVIISVGMLGHWHTAAQPLNSNVTAVYVFGDSSADPGNNDYFPTTSRSNFFPYGIDFVDHRPTGRYCNGRLVADFTVEYVRGNGTYLPAYLDPSLSLEDMMKNGVSFASAGSGYDNHTAENTQSLNMWEQLENFAEFKDRVESAIGKNATDYHFKRAAFVVSAGTDDLGYYFLDIFYRIRYPTMFAYQQFLLRQFRSFMQGLFDHGAQNIAVISLPPAGCLPLVISLPQFFSNSTGGVPDSISSRDCIHSFSAVASQFNMLVQNELKTMKASLVDLNIVYGDIYTPLLDIIQHPDNYGFEVVDRGCCGTGLFETSYTCNIFSGFCEDRSKHLFWDAVHPSERGYYFIFKALVPTIDFLLQNL